MYNRISDVIDEVSLKRSRYNRVRLYCRTKNITKEGLVSNIFGVWNTCSLNHVASLIKELQKCNYSYLLSFLSYFLFHLISLYRFPITLQNYFFGTSGGKSVGFSGDCDCNVVTSMILEKKQTKKAPIIIQSYLS